MMGGEESRKKALQTTKLGTAAADPRLPSPLFSPRMPPQSIKSTCLTFLTVTVDA